jgi:hypothetical protein
MALFVQDQIALGHTVYAGSYDTHPSGSATETSFYLWYVDLPSTVPVSISLNRTYLGVTASDLLLTHGPAISGLPAPSLLPYTVPAPPYLSNMSVLSSQKPLISSGMDVVVDTAADATSLVWPDDLVYFAILLMPYIVWRTIKRFSK